MKLGPAVRRLLPSSLERRAAHWYRLMFVDLDKVAECLSKVIPEAAQVLDIGGGDGELLNCLLRRRPDLRVTMVDIAPSVGRFLELQYRAQVRLCPGTPLEDHLAHGGLCYDAAIVSDVMHHIPGPMRTEFLRSVDRALRLGAPLFVKDLEPGHVVSAMSFYADKYISGDQQVSLVSMQELTDLARAAMPEREAAELGLLALNYPNYLMRFIPCRSPPRDHGQMNPGALLS